MIFKYILYKPNQKDFYDFIRRFGFKESNNVLIMPTNINVQEPSRPEYCIALNTVLAQFAMQYPFILFQLAPVQNT